MYILWYRLVQAQELGIGLCRLREWLVYVVYMWRVHRSQIHPNDRGSKWEKRTRARIVEVGPQWELT